MNKKIYTSQGNYGLGYLCLGVFMRHEGLITDLCFKYLWNHRAWFYSRLGRKNNYIQNKIDCGGHLRNTLRRVTISQHRSRTVSLIFNLTSPIHNLYASHPQHHRLEPKNGCKKRKAKIFIIQKNVANLPGDVSNKYMPNVQKEIVPTPCECYQIRITR